MPLKDKLLLANVNSVPIWENDNVPDSIITNSFILLVEANSGSSLYLLSLYKE